jgi:hypothetical protein
MSKFNTFTQLKELMFAMEQDLGISELSEPEKCVFSCIVKATEASGSISTKAIEKHILTSNLSWPTLFRVIKQLLVKDIITQLSIAEQ